MFLAYDEWSPQHSAIMRQVVDSSFISDEQDSYNLFKSEMASNVMASMYTIKMHTSHSSAGLNKHQIDDLIHNRYTPWCQDANTNKNIQVVVLLFNLLHAILSPMHTPKAKIQQLERDIFKEFHGIL